MVSEAGTLRPPVVLLDANLLYPFHLRNLLVQFAVERLIDVWWTDASGVMDAQIKTIPAALQAARNSWSSVASGRFRRNASSR